MIVLETGPGTKWNVPKRNTYLSSMRTEQTSSGWFDEWFLAQISEVSWIVKNIAKLTLLTEMFKKYKISYNLSS